MASITAPRVYTGDTGQVVTHEGVWKWVRLGRWLIMFIVIGVWVMTFPLPEPVRDWDGPEEQPPVETTVGESSSTVDITVSANPDYNGSN